MRLALIAAGWHLRWLASRPARLLLLPGGLLLALMADHTGQPAAQLVAWIPPLAVLTMTLGWRESRTHDYLRAAAARRSGALRAIALEGWLLPIIASTALAEAALAGLSWAGRLSPCWQCHLTVAFITLGTSAALAFTRGRSQRIIAGFIGALLVLQLLLPPGRAAVAELLLPTSWPALVLAGEGPSRASFHADIYMGLSMLLGVGLSIALVRNGLARPSLPQLPDPSSPSQGG